MSSATVVRPAGTVSDERIILARVSWETYKRLLADDEERRVPRMTYDQGVLELVTPSTPHEKAAQTLTLLVEIVAATLHTPSLNVGSTTYRRQDLQRGFEPDASFYVQNESLVRDRPFIDLNVDPPPDLVIEMEMSRSARDKLPLFASLGIPELWRSDGQRITILLLEQDQYHESSSSLALPVLTSDVLTRFLAESRIMTRPDWFEAVSAWAREQRSTAS